MSNIERDSKPLQLGGSLVTHFVTLCKSLVEARKAVPSLTPEQYRAIKAGRAEIVGYTNTDEGLTYKEIPNAKEKA